MSFGESHLTERTASRDCPNGAAKPSPIHRLSATSSKDTIRPLVSCRLCEMRQLMNPDYWDRELSTQCCANRDRLVRRRAART